MEVNSLNILVQPEFLSRCVKWFMHPLLALIANATESELAKYIEYLKVENQILRDRLPKKLDTTPAEREKLLKVGKPFGSVGGRPFQAKKP